MSDPFLGEIQAFPYNRAPRGWMPCDGALLQISQNQALFALLGTTYGGNGTTNFAIPDLRGRVPLHPGGAIGQNKIGGQAAVALTEMQMPIHTHEPRALGTPATETSPKDHVWSIQSSNAFAAAPNTDMKADAIGGVNTSVTGQPHPNMQPSLGLQFCIAVMGIFPPRS